MKKQGLLSLVALVAIFLLASCSKYEAKTVTLKTQNDSLNYTLGLFNGENLKSSFMKSDSSDKPLAAMMAALDKAYKSSDKGEMYTLGTKVGTAIKQQKASGFMGDSTIKFNEKLVRQGLVNGINGFDKGMTSKQAQDYIQKAMMKRQQEMMKQQIQSQGQQQMPQGQGAPQQAPQQPVK